MPINLGSCFPGVDQNSDQPNPIKVLVQSFLEQYYERYDNKLSRQIVSEAYHQNATFTLSSSFLAYLYVFELCLIWRKCLIVDLYFSTKGNLSHYSEDSRNLLKPDRNKKNRIIHKGRENIINFLDKLPKTKHDVGSFFIDVPLANVSLKFNLNFIFLLFKIFFEG